MPEMDALLERIASLEAQVAALQSALGDLGAGRRASAQVGMLMQDPTIAGLLVGRLKIKQANIEAGAVGQVQLQDGAVTANKISVSDLGAISANLGTVQTGLLRTAASGARLEIDSTGLKLYDAGGVQRGHLKNDGSGWLGSQTSFSWDTSGNLTIDGGRLAGGSVTGAKIADATITGAKIASGTITGANIASSTISDSHIVNVSADKLTAGSISAQLIVTGELATAASGARVRLSGAAYGGIIGYSSGDTYDPATGTGSYQILWRKNTGELLAGSGSVILNSGGVNLVGAGQGLRWLEAGTIRFQVAVQYGPGSPFLDLRSINYAQDCRLILTPSPTSNNSKAMLQAGGIQAWVQGNTYGFWVLRDDGVARRIGINTTDQLYVSAT